MLEKLAVLGGPKTCNKIPQPTPFFEEEINAAVNAMKKGLTIFSNPVVKKFEHLFAEYVGTKYAVSTSSGTSAMNIVLLSLKELNAIRYVIIPAYSYIGLVNAILAAGLRYKIVDNDADTLSISTSKLEKEGLEKATVVLLPYLFGLHPDIDGIAKLLNNPQLELVEDCAQGLGTYYKKRHVGTFGCGCFSFAENKTITTAGEGGMVVTNHKDVARLCRIISHQGIMWQDTEISYIDSEKQPTFYDLQHRFDCKIPGQSSRMTAVQAATGIVQLGKIDKINRKRRLNADYLIQKLSHHKDFWFPKIGDRKVATNTIPIIIKRSFYASRDVLLQCLIEEGVPALIYSPRPLFEYTLVKRTCSSSVSSKRYPIARLIAQRHILLPIHAGLTKQHLYEIASAFEKVVSSLSEPQLMKAARKEVAKKLGVSESFI